MTRKFSEEETFKFVQLYRQQECLWNIRCDAYKNKQMRTSALQQIQERMAIEGLTIDEVKAKIKGVRSTYYLEIDKIEKSTRFGAGGNVYVPRIKWFDELNSFIKNVAVRRITTDSTENTNDDSESSENQVPPPVSPCSENGSQVTPPVTPRSENRSAAEKRTLTPSLRSKRRKLSQMALMIKDLENMQDDNMPRTEETDHDFFGKSVSAQLKKLSEEQASIAQEKIQSILTQCRLADIRAKKSNSAFSFHNSQFSQSMQQFPNMPFSQLDPTQCFTSTQYKQSSYQPAPYCPSPEVSPSDITSSSCLGFHDNDYSDFSSYYNNNNDSVEKSRNL